MNFRQYVELREANVLQPQTSRQLGGAVGSAALDVAKDLTGYGAVHTAGKLALDIWRILKSPRVDQEILQAMSQADASRSGSATAALDVNDNTWNRLNPKAQQEMVGYIKQALQQLAKRGEMPENEFANQIVMNILQGKGLVVPPGVKNPQQNTQNQ